MPPVTVIYLVWGVWFLVWLAGQAAAGRQKPVLRGGVGFAFNMSVVAGVLFLLTILVPWPGTDMQNRLWDRAVPETLGWSLIAVAAIAIVFSAWANIHRIVLQRRGVKPVTSGPYAVVRHPVYLGLILAAAATVPVFGRPTSLLGAIVLTAALAGRAFMEDRKNRDETYGDYCRKVPMLVPFWPMRD